MTASSLLDKSRTWAISSSSRASTFALCSAVMGTMTDSGVLRVNGEATTFESPNSALDWGIATVFQDLAMVPQMPVYRNFVLGREPGPR